MIVSLETAKAHIVVDFDDDDVLLSAKLAAAQNHIERLLGYKIEEEFEADAIPASLVEAVCQLAAYWYAQREAVVIGDSVKALPYDVQEIVREYRNWSF